MNDLIDRQAVLKAMDTWDKFGCDPDGKLVRYDDDKHYVPYVRYGDMVHVIKHMPSADQEEFEWCHDCKEYDQERHCCHRFTKTIRDTVEEIKAWGNWTPCSERLPEEDTNVLVTVYFSGFKQTSPNGWTDRIKPSYYVDIASQIDGIWASASDEYKVAASRHKVVAWMPLPEPYKGDNDERVDSVQ